jgi:hypothetical protein
VWARFNWLILEYNQMFFFFFFFFKNHNRPWNFVEAGGVLAC